MNNKRNPILDIMKGITIILMMLGHTGIPDWLHTFIYSFHMPLFFILSGYFAKNEKTISWNGWKDVVRKSSKSLLLPYVFTALVVLLFTALRSFVSHDITIFTDRLVACVISTSGAWTFPETWSFISPMVNLSWAPVWFLLSLFFVRICFYGLQVCRRWTLLICVIISYVAVIIGRQTMIPFSLMQGLSGLVFYGAGWYYKHYGMSHVVLWLCVLAWSFSMVFTELNMMFYRYTYWPLAVLGACGGTYFIYWLSNGLDKISILRNALSWCGRTTMLILCLHSIDINCCWVGMLFNGALHLNIGDLWITIIRNVMVFIFAYCLSNISYVRRIFNLK